LPMKGNQMKCRVNLQSDPISLIVIAADGEEHQHLEAIGNDSFVDVDIDLQMEYESSIVSSSD